MDELSLQHSLNNASNSSEQLEDECQLWARSLRLLGSRLTLSELPSKERISWIARGICLPLSISRVVRTALLQLCSESDDRQSIIERLEESERHLRADIRYSQEKMQLYREKLAAIQQKGSSAGPTSALDSARTSVFLDSIPDSLLNSEREQELLNSKSVAANRAKALEAKVDAQEAEIRRLRKKLQELEHSDAERYKRQQEVFRTLKSRKPTRHSPLDNKMLDIIDSYECQLQRMRLELQGGCVHEASASQADASDDSSAPGKGYRLTIEQLNQQIASLSDQVQCLENEREVLCTELESRPTNSDHVLLISKLNRYEKLLRKHNIDVAKETAAIAGSTKDFSTRIEDIDLLPLSMCQKYLKEVARSLDIQDLKQIKETVADLVSISDAYGILHPILIKAQSLTQADGAPPLPEELLEQQLSESENRIHLLIPALEHWRDQLVSIPELHQSLERLFLHFYPWSSLDRLQAGPDVRLLTAAVDRMASDENYDLMPHANHRASDNSHAESKSGPQPPYSMLLGLVDHFQKLFDVAQIPGVCTKMNSIYSELGVCRNAMNSIKEALGLVEQTPMEAVVNAVARLMQLERLTVNDKLQEIFSHEDVQLALDRMEEYDQFFPVFESLVKNLMTLLGVSQVDQIIPCVAAYKRVFDSQNELSR